MSAHSPTPWFLDPDDRDGYEWNWHICSDASRNKRVCFMSNSGSSEANAAFIVRAVNAHDDLVAALKVAKQWVATIHLHGPTPESTGVMDLLAAAIAKAQAQP